MAKSGITILGLSDLRKDLAKLPLVKQARLLKAANRKAAKLVVNKLISANTHSKGKFSRRGKKGRHSDKPFIIAGVKGSKTAVNVGLNNDFFHYRFTEFGTVKRTTYNRSKLFSVHTRKQNVRASRTGGKYDRGIMPVTRPFINRVLDASISPLFENLKLFYADSVDKALKRRGVRSRGVGTNQNITPYRVK